MGKESMPPLSLFFLKIFKLGATAYGGPGMISQITETAVDQISLFYVLLSGGILSIFLFGFLK